MWMDGQVEASKTLNVRGRLGPISPTILKSARIKHRLRQETEIQVTTKSTSVPTRKLLILSHLRATKQEFLNIIVICCTAFYLCYFFCCSRSQAIIFPTNHKNDFCVGMLTRGQRIWIPSLIRMVFWLKLFVCRDRSSTKSNAASDQRIHHKQSRHRVIGDNSHPFCNCRFYFPPLPHQFHHRRHHGQWI